MNITREQYEADIRKAKVEALREYARPLGDNTLVDGDMIRNAADYYETQAAQ